MSTMGYNNNKLCGGIISIYIYIYIDNRLAAVDIHPGGTT